jgi:predicted AlkP superfamily phosphohydrolase/phosphomutase
MKSLPRFSAKELAMDLDLEKKCIIGLPQEEYEDWILLHVRREQQWFELLSHLMINDPTDLTGIVFDGVDKLQHLCWRFLDRRLFPKSPSNWEKHIRNLCLNYFKQIDAILAEIIYLSGSKSQTFIVSDHGFGDSTEVFYVNVWLHENGYLHWTDEESFDVSESLTANRLKDHISLVDWQRTSAYAITPSSNGIFIRQASDGRKFGVPASEYEAFRQRLIDGLLGFKDLVTGESVVKRVRTREEAYPGPFAALAPDLLLTLRDGGFVSILNCDTPLKPRAAPVGTHRPEGIFIAAGTGLRSGVTTAPLSILDIAPTVLFGLDVAIPEDFEGRVPTQIFEPSFLATHPMLSDHPGSQLVPISSDAPVDDDEKAAEAAIIEQLTLLNYLEKPSG